MASFSNRVLRGFLLEVCVETAALDHESVDDPVKDGAAVEAVFNVGEKICDRAWCLRCIELNHDASHGCFQRDPRRFFGLGGGPGKG